MITTTQYVIHKEMTYNIGFSISFKTSVIFLLFLTIYLKKDFYPVWTKDQYEVNSYQFLFEGILS
jgi:hypothetical protein